jgi:hypothetical protein
LNNFDREDDAITIDVAMIKKEKEEYCNKKEENK